MSHCESEAKMNRRDFIKAGMSGSALMAGGSMFAGPVLKNPGRKGKDRILAYSPPYGQNYLMDIETVNFMHRCGIDVVKLILSNSITAFGYPYSPYPPIWSDDTTYNLEVVDRQIADLVAQNPDVRFIAMIDLNSPAFIVTRYHLDSFTNLVECYLSPRWNELMIGYQKALLEHLERNHADRICGYYIACGTGKIVANPLTLTGINHGTDDGKLWFQGIIFSFDFRIIKLVIEKVFEFAHFDFVLSR